MKWYILTDLEGPCQVNRWDQTRVSEPTPLKLEAMRLLTAEVNAAVDGLFDADPRAEVVVWDGHGSGGIDLPSFHPRAWLLARGAGLKAPCCLDASFAGLLFVGQHAMAGTPEAPLCHTYSSKTVEYYQLNGEPVGEFGCRAAMAGAMGVPTIFIAGDDKACIEARAIVPEIITVETKLGLGIELALHRPLADVHRDLHTQVAEAVRRRGEIPPRVIAAPYHMEARVLPDCSVEGYLRYDLPVKQLDDRTVEVTVDDLCELWI